MTRAPVSRAFATAFVEYARARPAVVCLTNDLTASCEADGFRDGFPDRFYPLGMAEQNLIAIAGGMAREGLIPFYTTFGVFGTRRPYEQVQLAVAYPRLPVRIIGFLPGLTTPGGVTHQATDDLALMRLIPNMTVLELVDATDVETIWSTFDRIDGPLYCRMPRGEVPFMFDAPFELGRARLLRQGTDVVICASGAAVSEAIEASDRLVQQGIAATLLQVGTLKPFDDPQISDLIAASRYGVVTVENHLTHGALGTAVAELLAEAGLPRRLVRLGIADRFGHGGPRETLMARYGIGVEDVVDAAGRLTGAIGPRFEADDGPGRTLADAVAEGL